MKATATTLKTSTDSQTTFEGASDVPVQQTETRTAEDDADDFLSQLGSPAVFQPRILHMRVAQKGKGEESAVPVHSNATHRCMEEQHPVVEDPIPTAATNAPTLERPSRLCKPPLVTDLSQPAPLPNLGVGFGGGPRQVDHPAETSTTMRSTPSSHKEILWEDGMVRSRIPNQSVTSGGAAASAVPEIRYDISEGVGTLLLVHIPLVLSLDCTLFRVSSMLCFGGFIHFRNFFLKRMCCQGEKHSDNNS